MGGRMLKNPFGREKKVDANVQDVNEQTAPKKNKKRNEMMSSVLSESVLEVVLDDLRKNKRFIAEKDGQPVYIAMWLDVDDIGGLSKKQAKDEAKGSIIELIKGSSIKTLLTPELLESEEIIFVPEATTLDRMGEYSLLVNAPYTLGYIYDDGSIENSYIETEYDMFVKYIELKDDIDYFLRGHDVPWVEQSEDETYEEDVMSDDVVMAHDEDEDTPFGEGEGDDKDYAIDEFAEMESAGFDENYMEGSDFDKMDDTDLDNMEEDLVPEDEEVITDEIVEEEPVEVDDYTFEKTIKRVFYSDELGLEVTTEPFDLQFMHGNNFVPFSEDRGDGWMNEYLSNISKDANSEIQRAHQQNILEMRELYYRLLSGYCETIKDKLDVEDDTTLTGQIMNNLREEYQMHQDNMYNEVSQRRSDKNKDWTEKLEQVGEDAKIAAQQQYRERYGRQHDEELLRIEPTLKQQLEASHNKAVRELHEKRRADAAIMLDEGITATLGKVSEIYKERLNEEQEIYEFHRDALMNFIQDNRENDIAHDKILAQELAQSEKADAVMREYHEKLDAQTVDFAAKRESLEAEIQKLVRQSEDELKRQEDKHNQYVEDLRKELADARNHVNKLVDDYKMLDQKKEDEYRLRLTDKEYEIEKLSSNFERVGRSNRRQGGFMIALIIVAVIASLFVGMVFGMRGNASLLSDQVREQTQQMIEQRLDAIDSDNN